MVEALKKSGACQGDLVQARLVAGVVQMEDCTPCPCFCPVALSPEAFTPFADIFDEGQLGDGGQ